MDSSFIVFCFTVSTVKGLSLFKRTDIQEDR